MLNEEICKVRDKLNKSIEKNVDYAIIYKISVELDILIAKYYNEEFIEAKKNLKYYSEFTFSLKK